MQFSSLKLISILFVLIFFQACASGPFPAQQEEILGERKSATIDAPTNPELATVFIMQRDITSALYYLALEDSMIARWDWGTVKLELLPGTYQVNGSGSGTSFSAELYRWKPTSLTVKAGDVKYLLFEANRSSRSREPVWDTVIREFPGSVAEAKAVLQSIPLIESATPGNRIIPVAMRSIRKDCLQTKDYLACQSLLESSAALSLSGEEKSIAETVIAKQEQEVQLQQALEESIPPLIRMDKYMLELTDLLKTENYSAALPVFEKIEALNLPLDPNFDYFRGEAYLKSGQSKTAIKYLYQYIASQGRNASFYQDALKLINQAEKQI